MKKLTFNQFVQQAKKVHGNKYDYPEQEYFGKRGAIRFICKAHGERVQGAGAHLTGANCALCGAIKSVKGRTTGVGTFVWQAKQLHVNVDAYDKVVYVNTMTPVMLTCKVHGDYLVRPHNYLKMGQRCAKCAAMGAAVQNIAKVKYNARERDRMATDPLHAMKKRLRKRLRESLVKQHLPKDKKLCEVLGCNYLELVQYIERQFTENMSWKNMNLWHIDHRVPLATAATLEDVYRLNHYTNLQPLWAQENLQKNARLDWKIKV